MPKCKYVKLVKLLSVDIFSILLLYKFKDTKFVAYSNPFTEDIFLLLAFKLVKLSISPIVTLSKISPLPSCLFIAFNKFVSCIFTIVLAGLLSCELIFNSLFK